MCWAMVSTKTRVLSVRLPNDTADRIAVIARDMGWPQSRLIAQMLAEWLDSHDRINQEKGK